MLDVIPLSPFIISSVLSDLKKKKRNNLKRFVDVVTRQNVVCIRRKTYNNQKSCKELQVVTMT